MIKGELRSNIKKLWRHLSYILNIEKETRPISLSLHLTNKCNLNCDFCYLRNMDRTHELDYSKLRNFISVIKPKSVQLTGGEPCLYLYIKDLINFLGFNGIKIGMFTNGMYLRNIRNHLWMLDWLRVSINSYIDNDEEFVDPSNPKKLGYCYIKHKNSPKDLKERLIRFMDNHRGSYLKVEIDRFSHPQMLMTTDSPDLFMFHPKSKITVQEFSTPKDYKGKCYTGYLKPYLDGDGLVYPCWCTVDPKIRIRDKSKAITDIDHPSNLLIYQDIIMDCKRCVFQDRNEFINYIKEKKVEDEDFL